MNPNNDTDKPAHVTVPAQVYDALVCAFFAERRERIAVAYGETPDALSLARATRIDAEQALRAATESEDGPGVEQALSDLALRTDVEDVEHNQDDDAAALAAYEAGLEAAAERIEEHGAEEHDRGYQFGVQEAARRALIGMANGVTYDALPAVSTTDEAIETLGIGPAGIDTDRIKEQMDEAFFALNEVESYAESASSYARDAYTAAEGLLETRVCDLESGVDEVRSEVEGAESNADEALAATHDVRQALDRIRATL